MTTVSGVYSANLFKAFKMDPGTDGVVQQGECGYEKKFDLDSPGITSSDLYKYVAKNADKMQKDDPITLLAAVKILSQSLGQGRNIKLIRPLFAGLLGFRRRGVKKITSRIIRKLAIEYMIEAEESLLKQKGGARSALTALRKTAPRQLYRNEIPTYNLLKQKIEQRLGFRCVSETAPRPGPRQPSPTKRTDLEVEAKQQYSNIDFSGAKRIGLNSSMLRRFGLNKSDLKTESGWEKFAKAYYEQAGLGNRLRDELNNQEKTIKQAYEWGWSMMEVFARCEFVKVWPKKGEK